MSQDPCDLCGKPHPELKFHLGQRVRLLSMMPHRMAKQWFHKEGEPKDRSGEVGVIVQAETYERIGATGYVVNFNLCPEGPWDSEPANECQLELAEAFRNPFRLFMDIIDFRCVAVDGEPCVDDDLHVRFDSHGRVFTKSRVTNGLWTKCPKADVENFLESSRKAYGL